MRLAEGSPALVDLCIVLRRIACLLLFGALAACAPAPPALPVADAEEELDYPDAEVVIRDTGRRDTGIRDTGARDLGIRDAGIDTGVPLDTGVPADTGVPPDTGIIPDAGPPPDSGPRNPVLNLPAPIQIGGRNFQLPAGPVWRGPNLPAPNNTLLFSDLPSDAIYRASPPAYAAMGWRFPTSISSGLANDVITGFVLAAEHDSRRISITDSNAMATTLVDRWNGMRFNSPNDLVVRSDGTIYFTDPPYGLRGRTREIPFNGVFRIAPDRSVDVVWRGQVTTPTVTGTLPNGIDLSPDETVLYVADAAYQHVLAFDVSSTGTTSPARVFVDTAGSEPSGVSVDEQGNVYVTTFSGIEVFAPDGRPWGVIQVRPTPNNITFGGPTRRIAFITTQNAVFRIEPMHIPGAR